MDAEIIPFPAGSGPVQPEAAPASPAKDRAALSLWLWVAAGFLFLAVLWTAMFIAARQVDTRTVPLATKEAKP